MGKVLQVAFSDTNHVPGRNQWFTIDTTFKHVLGASDEVEVR